MGEGEASVVVGREGPVGVLRLNEPHSLNALSPAIKAGLEEAVPRLLDDGEIRAVVLTGT
ncbi:enoyl-CoA hydratase/isomerase family protein, partial [Vibrio cholerae]|nr:enoyl-CoA hydratase/isomerase family protein [Vibrio cholerae]